MQRAGRLLRSDAAWSLLTAVAMAGVAVGIAGGLLRLPTPLVLVGVGGSLALALILAQPYIGLVVFLALHYFLGILFPQNAQIESLRLPLCVSSLTLVAWLVHLLGRGERFTWTPHLGWMLLFAVAIVASAYRLPDNGLFVEAVLHAGRLALLFLLLQQLPWTEGRLGILLHSFLLFNVGLALSAIYGWFTGSGAILDRGRMRAVVMAGSFNDPNDLAAHLAIALPLALLFAWQRGSGLRRLWGVVALGILLVALWLCGSRGGLLATGVGLGVLAIRRLGWAAAVPVALLIAFFALGNLAPLGESLAADDSAMGRVEAWRAGLSMFQQSPLVGVGYEQFSAHYRIGAHNTFVHALAEGGLFSAVTWVGIHYWALLTLARVRRSEEGEGLSGYAAALQAGLLAALTAGLFLSHTYRPIPLIPVGLAASVAIVAQKSERRASDWPHYLAVPAVVLAGIGVIYLVTRGLL